MTDKELLELAAKAAGFQLDELNARVIRRESDGQPVYWNPLTDDGDALRLAVKCGLVVDCSRPSAGLPYKQNHMAQEDFLDANAATRRAIVRAAAEIGRGMK